MDTDEIREGLGDDAEENRELAEIRDKMRRGLPLRPSEERLIQRLKARGKMR